MSWNLKLYDRFLPDEFLRQGSIQTCQINRTLIYKNFTRCRSSRIFQRVENRVCPSDHFSRQNESDEHARLPDVDRRSVNVDMVGSGLTAPDAGSSRSRRRSSRSGSSFRCGQSVGPRWRRLTLNEVNDFLVDSIVAQLLFVLNKKRFNRCWLLNILRGLNGYS